MGVGGTGDGVSGNGLRVCDLQLRLPVGRQLHRGGQHRAGGHGDAGSGYWGQLDMAGELWVLTDGQNRRFLTA